MKTLLHLIEPVSGQIVYGSGLRPYEIGYLPQQTPVQRDFPASVLEVVLSGCLSKLKLRFFYSAAEKKAARLIPRSTSSRSAASSRLALPI